MTIEERVDSICKWNNPGLYAVVLEAMTAAVEEEREACAKIADEYRATLTRNAPPEPMQIARRIRARSTEVVSIRKAR